MLLSSVAVGEVPISTNASPPAGVTLIEPDDNGIDALVAFPVTDAIFCTTLKAVSYTHLTLPTTTPV